MKLVQELEKSKGLHVTTAHTGKMLGMQSISTNCRRNTFCQAYAKDKTKVCSKCYAIRQTGRMPSMQKPLDRNYDLLTTSILSKDELPLLNACYFRFESFGDLQNEIQVINYFNICKANKHTKFALWTKNPGIIRKAIKNGAKKPKNLNILLSSHYINKKANAERFDFVDKTFTVYDKTTAKKEEININCGARQCMKCLICYTKNNIKEVNELIK